MQRVILSGQDSTKVPASLANHSLRFGSSPCMPTHGASWIIKKITDERQKGVDHLPENPSE